MEFLRCEGDRVLMRLMLLVWTLLLSCSRQDAETNPESTCPADSLKSIPMQELKEFYKGNPVEIKENVVIEGFVISSDGGGNIFGSLYVQDRLERPDMGIEILTDLTESAARYPVGTRVLIQLEGLWFGKRGDGFAIGSMRELFGTPSLDRLPALSTLEHLLPACEPPGEPVPQLRDRSDLNERTLHTLVRLNDLEVAEEYKGLPFAPEGAEAEVPLIGCNGPGLKLVNSGYSDFHDSELPAGSGSAIGILTGSEDDYRLIIREPQDLLFTEASCVERFPPVRSDQILISELADPDNAPEGRFLELYNAGDSTMDLRQWSLRRYTNANEEPGSIADLTGLVIEPGATIVFTAYPEAFSELYGTSADAVLSRNGPADSNGDDTILLVNPFDEVTDALGVPGVDGSGTAHEFEDGRAVRNAEVVFGSPVFNPDEWVIKNDTGSDGTLLEPQSAPTDFTPGAHPD